MKGPEMMHKVYIGIGSNVSKEKNIKSCIVELRKVYENIILSPVYETSSMGFDGPNFYNLVSSFDTTLSIYDLKANLNSIENDHGRHFNETKFSSRTLDIDILYYDNQVISNEKIKIPRKEIIEYDFVLTPLIDIAPNFIHPVLKISHTHIMESTAIEKQIISKIDFDL
ncbi:MAG: 2-amino-4-hydroxy-6-hydroxymethyldihydropteridine diphosphokinase [Gammaproteobacteria bacterium]|mgnify:FL=1|nr:2-amino-4-hydroxy-6-hydroxymethyldihydropteridine diphosphokinase [Gammaproteobacteria bacterium]MBT5406592.1 2-amino-4-hydroxy-6-hydroxymethyldihydropteridine diphosphokinase [Gammaproteobacteria bacterium]MBT6734377.1 2-amino-4-hydroxy-6-hydroxymethyldihydropteridine diphosphokinase [Gammaproteobacteria bacterium]